jgi:hypothetical protein
MFSDYLAMIKLSIKYQSVAAMHYIKKFAFSRGDSSPLIEEKGRGKELILKTSFTRLRPNEEVFQSISDQGAPPHPLPLHRQIIP